MHSVKSFQQSRPGVKILILALKWDTSIDIICRWVTRSLPYVRYSCARRPWRLLSRVSEAIQKVFNI